MRLSTKPNPGPEVLGLYLKRPRAKSWDSRRCVGALRIQRLEGSRPRGLWDLYREIEHYPGSLRARRDLKVVASSYACLSRPVRTCKTRTQHSKRATCSIRSLWIRPDWTKAVGKALSSVILRNSTNSQQTVQLRLASFSHLSRKGWGCFLNWGRRE